jgi:hypothetical protein
MEIEAGYCQCGCGQKTKIATKTHHAKRWEKGKPRRFVVGHHCRRKRSHAWRGGRTVLNGYPMTYLPEHHRAINMGYVRDHVLMAEKALGKPLPENSEVHHFPNKENWTHLIICQDHSFHEFLEVRFRAFKACGRADWRKCPYCHKWDDPGRMYVSPMKKMANHRECHKVHGKKGN